MNPTPTTLQGAIVRLEPLSADHFEGLAAVAYDPEIWRWTQAQGSNEAELRDWVAQAFDLQSKGTALPFTIFDQTSGKIIGSTRFANIERAHRRLEIGWTWLAQSHQRTGANTEAKLLLMTHAFETLGAIRVELKTDSLNEKSRAAILRIGAVQEGILRNHMILHNGRVRHTVYFSITDDEWPAAKARLLEKLAAHRA